MKLLMFGFGYTAAHTAQRLRLRGASIVGTVRTPAKAQAVPAGITLRVFNDEEHDPALHDDIAQATHLLVSIPPQDGHDPTLRRFYEALAGAPRLGWIGYLSTIGVYGDQGGAWVDESTPTSAGRSRSGARIEAEAEWLALSERTKKAVQVFRLGGIYGPGRNPFINLAQGTARRIAKPGQVFNRIHVADIAAVLDASMTRPRAGAIYNVVDDEPAPPQDVVAYAAALASMDPPAEIPFEQAQLSPMARSFYSENRRVSNALIKAELGVRLTYPSYREGLRALLASGEAAQAA